MHLCWQEPFLPWQQRLTNGASCSEQCWLKCSQSNCGLHSGRLQLHPEDKHGVCLQSYTGDSFARVSCPTSFRMQHAPHYSATAYAYPTLTPMHYRHRGLVACAKHEWLWLCLQLAHPLLKAAGRSSVVMISSVAGGPLAIQSGSIYGMLKGVLLKQKFFSMLLMH